MHQVHLRADLQIRVEQISLISKINSKRISKGLSLLPVELCEITNGTHC